MKLENKKCYELSSVDKKENSVLRFEQIEKRKNTAANNVYDVHCQQKLATPHTRGRWLQLKKKKLER